MKMKKVIINGKELDCLETEYFCPICGVKEVVVELEQVIGFHYCEKCKTRFVLDDVVSLEEETEY